MSFAPGIIESSTSVRESFWARLGRGISLTASGQALASSITFVAMLFAARILGTARFGELGLVQSSLQMFGIFAGFGLGATATRFVARHGSENTAKAARVIGLTMGFGLITSLLLFVALQLATPWIATRLFLRPELVLPLRIGAFVLCLATIEGITSATLRGFEAFRSIAMVVVSKAVCALMIVPPLTYMGHVLGAVIALTACQALATIVSCLLLARVCKRRGVALHSTFSAIDELPILWQFSLPTMVASTLVVPIAWVGRTILVRQADGFSELGMFQVANQWLALLMIIPTVVGSVLLPMIGADNTMSKLSTAALPRLLLITAIASLLISGACLVLSDPILAMYGPEFSQAKSVFAIVIMTTGFSAVNELIGQSLLGLNAPFIRLFTTILWAMVFLAAAYLLVPRYLAVGLALARLIAASSYTAIQLPICLRQSKIRRAEYLN